MDKKVYPKVLVVSHNVFSTTSNMGKTMDAFFKGWDNMSLAQLYFHSEIPNSDTCKKHFRITEFDLFKSLFTFKAPGEVVELDDAFMDSNSSRIDRGIKAEVYKWGRRITPIMYLIRNLIWKSGIWHSGKLINWIDEFNPEVVFFPAGDYSFSIEVALKICKERNIPLVVFFGDEYYFLEVNRKLLLSNLNHYYFKKSFYKLFTYLSTYICASDKMLKLYSDNFSKKGYSIMTPTIVNHERKCLQETNIKISYIGNLEFERWKPLIEIGKHLKAFNLFLDIYSHERSENILSELSTDNGIKFHGAISSREVKHIIALSTIIVHVESMDRKNSDKTRYSMSTKIAESLGSGTCIFAYGPNDISSIEYLLENDVACVVTDPNQLEESINTLVHDSNLRKKYIENALNLAKKRHGTEKNRNLLYKILNETCEKRKSETKHEDFTN